MAWQRGNGLLWGVSPLPTSSASFRRDPRLRGGLSDLTRFNKGGCNAKAIVCGGSRRLDVVDGNERTRRRHAPSRAEGAAARAGLQLDRLLSRSEEHTS